MYSIGIDSGSRTTKLCLYNIVNNSIIDYYKEETLKNHEEQIDKIISQQLIYNNIDQSQIESIVITGYGRKNYSKSNRYSSEIICHASGVNYLNKKIKTVIDIGGQDSKIIKLSDNGKVKDFLMNDKCAAGTGRFLEKIAEYFKISLEDMGKIALSSTKDVEISSTCVVFAESEIIGLVSSGEKIEDIINSVLKSVVHRILSMSGAVGLDFPVAFVGGVARNVGMVRLMKELIGDDIYIPLMPEYTGAVGAALSCIGDLRSPP